MIITAMKKEYAVGVDLGGTKIVTGLVRRDGKIIGEPVKVSTQAEGLSYVVNILDPDIIVIGGSLSNAYELFVESLENSLKKHINPLPQQNLKITKTGLGGNAGLAGAACLAFFEKTIDTTGI